MFVLGAAASVFIAVRGLGQSEKEDFVHGLLATYDDAVDSQILEYDDDTEALHFRRRYVDRVDFSFVSRFMLRTTDVPLGPKLNKYSIGGVFDQNQALIGLDFIKDGTTKGVWPIFGTTHSNIQIDKTNNYWIDVYKDGKLKGTSVNCGQSEVIVGIRYSSHEKAASGPVSLLPDIQCTKLIIAQVNTYALGTTHSQTREDLGNDKTKVTTEDSVKDVKQCMLNGNTTVFTVTSSGGNKLLNTCGGGRTPKSVAPPSFLVKLITDMKRVRHRGNMGTPGLVDFLVVANGGSDDNLFGSSSTSSGSSMNQPSSLDAAKTTYQSTWGDSVPTSNEIQQNLGAQPWDSPDLLSNSPEFVSGTLMSGDGIMFVTGFGQANEPDSLDMTCSRVLGCENGTCDDKSGCICDKGYSGKTCASKLDPCGDRPCGQYGTCTEHFDLPKGFTCTCQEGFSGYNCEVTDNKCLKKTSSNEFESVDCGHGDCVSKDSGYACKCKAGWKNEGDSPTGSCTKQSGDCVGDWTGLFCNKQCKHEQVFVITDPAIGDGMKCTESNGTARVLPCSWGDCRTCMSKDCNKRGTCDDNIGVCTCNAGFGGPNCEMVFNDCSTNKCSSHGNCIGDSGEGGCTCLNGWSNDLTNSTLLCSKDPCKDCPAGLCNYETGLCACKSGGESAAGSACAALMGASDCKGDWDTWGSCGSECLQRRYFSISSPAMGGGALCAHKPGDVDTRPCTSGTCCKLVASDCLNGGTLLNTQCQCMCTAGFQGNKCEISLDDTDRVLKREAEVENKYLTTSPSQSDNKSASSSQSQGSSMLVIGVATLAIVLLLGGWYMKKKKAPVEGGESATSEEALLAGMEGMEGLDFSDLGLPEEPKK